MRGITPFNIIIVKSIILFMDRRSFKKIALSSLEIEKKILKLNDSTLMLSSLLGLHNNIEMCILRKATRYQSRLISPSCKLKVLS